jgi:hypothetical protein
LSTLALKSAALIAGRDSVLGEASPFVDDELHASAVSAIATAVIRIGVVRVMREACPALGKETRRASADSARVMGTVKG